MGLEVREPRPSDLPAIGGLLDELGYAIDAAELHCRVDEVMRRTGHRVWVAELEGTVAGLLHAFERVALEKGAEAVVQALVVTAGIRGRGVGQALMREVEQWAASRSLPAVILHTRVDRNDARAFYAACGYEEVAASRLLRKRLGADTSRGKA